MINARSSTHDRRASAPKSWARPPTSSRVINPPTASKPGTILRTSRAASRAATQAPDPRSHAGQRRNSLDRASSDPVAASSTGAQTAKTLGRVIGIITTTVLLEVPADPEWRPDELSENEESWLAS